VKKNLEEYDEQQNGSKSVSYNDSGYLSCFSCYDEQASSGVCDICLELNTKALTIRYPVILKLLGEQVFVTVTNDYLIDSIGEFTDIDNVGSDFSRYLKSNKLSSVYPYISDLAALEWLIATLPLAQTAHQPTNKFSRFLFSRSYQLKVCLSSSVELFESCLGAVEIWLTYQSGNQKCDLQNKIEAKMSHYWIIKQSQQGLSLTPLASRDYWFYQKLQKNISIGRLNQLFGRSMLQELLPPLLNSQHCQFA